MKPGTLNDGLRPGGQVQLDPTQPATVGEVERVESRKERVPLEETLPDGKSQLPPVPASRTDTPGESQLVKSRVDAREEQEEPAKKGKRQKLLKVLEAKTLNKPGKSRFKSLAEILDGGVQKL